MKQIPAFIIAGTHSGCGKTTVSIGIMAALTRRGMTVQPYKCGPDFIDPTLHREVCGRVSRNLDIRMCGLEWTKNTFNRHLQASNAAVVEGVMGMFDGGAGSAAALAKYLGLPLILVVDVRSQAESVAAVVKGFCDLDPEVTVAGVICNRVGSERHQQLIAAALKKFCRVQLFGFLPRSDDMVLPTRHLGLYLGTEQGLNQQRTARLARLIEDNLCLDKMLAHCRVRPQTTPPLPAVNSRSSRRRIAVAWDQAFCFYYQDNLDLLMAGGAELLFFSPLSDNKLPADIDALYLGGGYPELAAAQLTANGAMLVAVKKFCADGGLCYAECGGFMYLCRTIEDQKGMKYPMAGVFPVDAKMGGKHRALGYREVELGRDCFLGPAGTRLAGHEFHYSEISQMPVGVERIYRLNNGGREGFSIKNTIASYIHLHFGANPAAAGLLAGEK